MNAINSGLPPGPNVANLDAAPSHTPSATKVQEVANNCFTFAALPNELQIHVLSFFDLRELANFSVTSCDANEHALDPQIWRGIAKRINCPLDKSVDSRTQVLNFIADIQRRAQKIHPLPKEIADILRRPTIDQINMIQDWLQARQNLQNWNDVAVKFTREFPLLNFQGPGEIDSLTVTEVIAKGTEYEQHLELFKARDTLFVWRQLAAAAGLQDPNLAELTTKADIINRSKEFDGWFVENREVFGGLTHLDLNSNLLTSIPSQIVQLSNLLELNLSCNLLTAIPKEIGQLTNLQSLILDNNYLTAIPKEIGQLTNLQHLDLYSNQLTSIPNEIGTLVNLQELYLSNNHLTSLPKDIGHLANLQHLNLYKNQLTSIPKEIGQLTNLQKLNLCKNQLTSIPEEIGQLTNLQYLHLYSNHLTSIPEEISQLTNLQYLHLYSNHLTSIPEEIGQLTNLQELYLYSNQLTSIPKEIGQLTNLQYLDLSDNQLTSIPEEIGQLTNLQYLHLYSNQLTSIPEEIGQLTNLQKLNLGMNELTSIPAALLLKGIDLFLEDNPLSFKINASIFLKDNIKQISIIASAAALTVFGLYYYPSSVPNAISSLRGLCWRLRVMTTAMPLDMWPEFILREIFGPRH